MENIVLYLALAIGGTLSGWLVNFIVDRLYLGREVFEADFIAELRQKGWTRYLLNPLGFTSGERRFKIRSVIVDLALIASVLLLGFLKTLKATAEIQGIYLSQVILLVAT